MCDERNPAPASDECISFPWPTDLVIALATQEAPPLPASDERSPRWRSLGGNAAQEWFAAKRSSTLGMLRAHIPLKGFAGGPDAELRIRGAAAAAYVVGVVCVSRLWPGLMHRLSAPGRLRRWTGDQRGSLLLDCQATSWALSAGTVTVQPPCRSAIRPVRVCPCQVPSELSVWPSNVARVAAGDGPVRVCVKASPCAGASSVIR